MKKCLATDLDGTLFYPVEDKYKYVCQNNLNALKGFEKVVIVSGRPAKFIKKVCDEIQSGETFVGCNGSIIYLNGEIIFVDYLDTVWVNEAIDYVKNNYETYTILLFDKDGDTYSISDDPIRIENKELEGIKNVPKLVELTIKDETLINKLLSQENSIIKFNILLSEPYKSECYDYLINKYSDKIECAKCRNFIEINSKGINKADGLKKLVRAMNLNDDEVFVIGDDTNDLAMLSSFKNSFLVKNKNNIQLQTMVKNPIDSFADLTKFSGD